MIKIKVSIKYVIILLLSLVFLYVQGGSLPHVLFYMLFIPFILNLLFIIILRFGLKISNITMAKFYTCGDKELVDTRIKNNTILVLPYCKLTNEGILKIKKDYGGDALTLSVNEEQIISEDLACINRGKFDLGRYEVEIKDILGIFTLKYKTNESKWIKVYPRVYDMSETSLKGTEIVENAVSILTSKEDPHSTRDMRKYREGDSLKRINWKVSAKLNDLYVRNFDTVSGEEYNIFIDMNESNYSLDPYGKNEELLIDFSASLIYSLLKKNISSKVFINNENEKNIDVDNKIDFEKFLEYLIDNRSEGKEPITNFIKVKKAKLSSIAGMAIITHTLSDGLANFIIENKENGSEFVVFYIKSAIDDISISTLKRIGVVCSRIDEGLSDEVAISIEELIKGQVS